MPRHKISFPKRSNITPGITRAPNLTFMRGTLKGRRVHAVVSRLAHHRESQSSLFYSRHKLSNAWRNDAIAFRVVIPQPDRAVAMPEKEVAIRSSAYHTDLFPAPPLYFKRPPVVLANQARYLDHTVTAADFVPPSEISYSLLHRVYLATHDG
jgi:hypothetical protein